MDDVWQREAAQIYKEYSIWHQSGGAEQNVFDSSGVVTARSRRILERLRREVGLPNQGRLLDIGCGNGSLLATASQILPEWGLAGTEFDDKHRDRIESIPAVERLYTGSLAEIPGSFDLITLSHVFEHWTEPGKLLKLIAGLMKPEAYLLIQVPDYSENPFELLVADHCSHFCPSTLAEVVGRSECAVGSVATDWVPREVTLVARRTGSLPLGRPEVPDPAARVARALSWLNQMRECARQSLDKRQFGIFGTSIAGTWLYGEIGERVSFFVDEDSNRAGKTHLGIKTLLPRDAPANSVIFVPLPGALAQRVGMRLREEARPSIEYRTIDPLVYSDIGPGRI